MHNWANFVKKLIFSLTIKVALFIINLNFEWNIDGTSKMNIAG